MANFKTARTTSDKTSKYKTQQMPTAPGGKSKMGGSTEKRGSVRPTKMTGSR